jgi:hypothetical protein
MNEINTFHKDTPERVKELLKLLNFSRRRVRIWYGDKETGRAWNEERHVTGTIGRSSGYSKIPLMIPNRRSLGGPALLDDCIIRIDDINDRKTLYRHPNFHVDLHKIGHEVLGQRKDGTFFVQARFNHPLQADNYIKFMTGERYKL